MCDQRGSDVDPFESPGVVAIVPARAGSKGIPAKNVYPLNGRPLIEYTLRTLHEVAAIGSIVVTSDSQEILEVCRGYGGRTRAVQRDEKFALDHTTTDEVLADLFEKQLDGEIVGENTIIVLAQPTSPLRTPQSVERALDLFRRKTPEAKMIMSLVRAEKNPYKACTTSADGMIKPIVDADSLFAPRQALPAAYYPNGAIYVFRVADFLAKSCLPRTGIYGIEMQEEESIDIDTLGDIVKAEAILNQENEE